MKSRRRMYIIWMKLVCLLITSLTIGFAVGESQSSYVVVDSTLRRKYQAEPGRQEWVTVIECACADGSSIPPMVIFKGENLMSSCIPTTAPKGWYFSCNTKGWTSNVHGGKWLVLFNSWTADKANKKKRLLICDGHDSHISAEFVRYCMDNDILILLLVPHSSHITQPLDVGVFGPLKRAMSYQLDHIFRTGVSRLQKVEWMESYIAAREVAINTSNILGGWRGAGLFPLNKQRILHQLFDKHPTPSPPQQTTTLNLFLNNSSPPDALVLHSANAAFNSALFQTEAITPVKTHGRRLSRITERLYAENAILRKENSELKTQIRKRKERTKGKRLVLKNIYAIATEEVQQALAAAQRATREGRKKGKQRKSKQRKRVSSSEEEEEEEEDAEDESEEEGVEMQDCIEVIVS